MERVAILGGTGPEGRGLALRFALAGLEVVVGSRSEERAQLVAQELMTQLRAVGCAANVAGAENAAAAGRSDFVSLACPYSAVKTLAPQLSGAVRGKVVLDVVNPLRIEDGFCSVEATKDGSAAEEIQRLLPEGCVVSAFKDQSAEALKRIDRPLAGDVIVCSDQAHARARVMQLAGRIANLRAVDGGALANARSLESIAALLFNLNRRHHATTSIKILGLPDPSATTK